MKTVSISFVLLGLTVLALPMLATAQIDSGPNGIGIYFDQEATIVSATGEIGDSVTAYLIGTNLIEPGEIGWWEMRICPEGAAFVQGMPTHDGFNYSMNMPGDGCWSCTTGYFDPPLMSEPITVLATLNIEIYGDLEPINLYILPGAEYWLFDMCEDGVALNPSSGDFALPVATINGETPVSLENVEWGAIKSMFR